MFSFLCYNIVKKGADAMNSTIYDLSLIKNILYPVFDNYHIKKAILFGSYAKGCAKENSDIDILVDSGLRGLAFFGLLEDVVNALDKSVDMIDVSQVKPGSDVDNEIMQSGVLIYGE